MTVFIRRMTMFFLVTTLAVSAAFAADAPQKGSAGVVNINTATVAQLSLLPRVGPSSAARIVEYRSANGGFQKTTDLLQVKGIGQKTFELMKPYLAVEGETTLKAKVRGPKRASSSRSSQSSD